MIPTFPFASPGPAPQASAHFTRIERVLDYIHGHLDQPLSLEQLAEQSCWSRWQLQRVFLHETGLTVAHYVRELKLSLAAEALLSSRQRVLDLALSYTRQDMAITRDTTSLQGKTPVWVPKQMASLWSNYLPGGQLEGMRVGAGLRYVGEAQLDAANTDTVPDYLLMDMSASYDLAQLSQRLQGVEASLSASNLFNKTYYSCYDQNNCWFGAERNVEARLKYVF